MVMRRLAPLILLLAACFDTNLHRETYQDGRMARNFGAYDRGIVPAFIPDDARNVTTANHDITGEVWVRCELPGDTLAAVTSAVPQVAMQSALANMQAPPEFLGQWIAKPPGATSVGFIYRQGAREWHGVIEPDRRLCFVYCLPK
jgi:hypothetical protein